MYYPNIQQAVFLERPNRFIAHILVEGKEQLCHVKNTGRCKELLIPNTTIYVQHHDNPNRKTKYSLIAVQKGELLINMDSQVPNQIVAEWLKTGKLFPDLKLVKPETVFGSSRFDFYLETSQKKIFMEVKGCTLEQNGVMMFPDAPTQRGVKHIQELILAKQQGYDAYLIFVIQMKGARYFTPNRLTHPEFADVLLQAEKAGVNILAVDCMVMPDSIEIDQQVLIQL
ncbi:DNA/RNA nuclease SfsA [Clostridium facile]|uniref:Sugar fermentation stimulation protein homolog n=1 Tax=Clostridium facile TaxID=2763035 RepID=A0ABR7IN98_9CLOT|nr:DNA/RNA nuclease SfsA [Clostridium facile]MBC5786539.1 DNA/RNA nuclease SfsA [Clostridium facile]